MGALHNPVTWSQLSRASSTLGRFHGWHDLAQLAQAQRPSSYASHAQWLMTDGTLRSWPESSSACTDAVARRSCHGSRSDGSAGCCQTSSAKLPKSLQAAARNYDFYTFARGSKAFIEKVYSQRHSTWACRFNTCRLLQIARTSRRIAQLPTVWKCLQHLQ